VVRVKDDLLTAVLFSTVLPAFIVGVLATRIPGDLTTKFVAVFIPTFVAFVVSMILAYGLMRGE
jgi:mannitol-specific phosphotransferase system IIBC component